MGILDGPRGWWRKRKRDRARAAIHEALDEAYERAVRREIAAGAERIVIFSDHHKGARDGADDFQRCERTYNAALAYYDALGYELFELGDVEELWENSLADVAACYPDALRLAAAFAPERYTRFWGNHDLAWSSTELFREHMARFGYGAVAPIEAMRLAVKDDAGALLAELFLVHGHQGTASSDRNAATSRFFVRYGWRPLQNMLNRPWNPPAVDWELRGRHARDMAAWAQEHKRVLIAGHTHLPVFFGARKEPSATPADVGPAPGGDARAEALRRARLEWAKAEEERLRRQRPPALETPCYFNTGCCSFGDGDITGLEIDGGELRLVRWPSTPQTDRVELAHMPLDAIRRAVEDGAAAS